MRFTGTPRGVLPRAKGVADTVLKFEGYTRAQLLKEGYSPLTYFFKEAVKQPGVIQLRYFEENGYEYEYRATYDIVSNTITTNLPCPVPYKHHIGQTCSCCGQKD
jgi:hypothetical protein